MNPTLKMNRYNLDGRGHTSRQSNKSCSSHCFTSENILYIIVILSPLPKNNESFGSCQNRYLQNSYFLVIKYTSANYSIPKISFSAPPFICFFIFGSTVHILFPFSLQDSFNRQLLTYTSIKAYIHHYGKYKNNITTRNICD